jgi:hypothetical protein
LDIDLDGHTLGQEQLAGTDPLDTASVLALRMPTVTGTAIRISWAAVPGRSYVLQAAPVPVGDWQDVPGTATNASAATVEFTRPLDPLLGRFYRVRLVAP